MADPGGIMIRNFKSLGVQKFVGVGSFAVFAGPNGSGKSNLFDALNLVGILIRSGAQEALQRYGGYESIHCARLRKQNARRFHFMIGWDKKVPTLQPAYIQAGSPRAHSH